MELGTVFTIEQYDEAYEYVIANGYTIKEIGKTEKEVTELETYSENEETVTVIQEAVYDDEGNLVSEEVAEKTIIPVEKTREVTKTVIVSQYQIVEIPVRILTYEDIRQARASAYEAEVDPLTAQIQRLRDEEATTNELEAEIRALIEERKTRVAEIKARYPYPAESIEQIDELPVVEEVVVSEMETVDIVD